MMARAIVAALLAVTVKCGLAAAEPAPAASTAYRLTTEQTAFRLPVKETVLPASEPRKSPAIPSLLTDKPYAALIRRAAQDTALDPALVHAVIFVESRYNSAARSPKGAMGLMQVMPGTALRYGVTDSARSLEGNLRAGTRYLRDLMQQFNGRLDLVLAAYNAGENAVVRHGQRIPPFRETQRYVPNVLGKYREWRAAPVEPVEPVVPPATVQLAHIEYLSGTRLDPASIAFVRQD